MSFEQELRGNGLLYTKPIAVPAQKSVDVKIKLTEFNAKENTLTVQVLEQNADKNFVVLNTIMGQTDIMVLSTTGVIRLELTVAGPVVGALVQVPKGDVYTEEAAPEPSERADDQPLKVLNIEEAQAEAQTPKAKAKAKAEAQAAVKAAEAKKKAAAAKKPTEKAQVSTPVKAAPKKKAKHA